MLLAQKRREEVSPRFDPLEDGGAVKDQALSTPRAYAGLHLAHSSGVEHGDPLGEPPPLLRRGDRLHQSAGVLIGEVRRDVCLADDSD